LFLVLGIQLNSCVFYSKEVAMSEKGDDPVHVHIVISASVEKVYAAWTQPEIISQWLFVGPTSEIVHAELDLEPGGMFSILELERTDGEFIDHYGTYIEIEEPKKLVFTLSVPKHFPGETRVTVDVSRAGKDASLTLIQSGVTKEKTERSWQEMFQNLKKLLEGTRQNR